MSSHIGSFNEFFTPCQSPSCTLSTSLVVKIKFELGLPNVIDLLGCSKENASTLAH